MKAGVLASPLFARALGAQGGNTGKPVASPATAPWVDMPFTISQQYPGASGIYVPYAGISQQSNGGTAVVRLYLCPESERAIVNLPFSGTLPNGVSFANPINGMQNFQGVPIPCTYDYAGTGSGAVQGQIVPMVRPVFVPVNWFLRVANEATTASSGSTLCYLEMLYYPIIDPCTDLAL